MMSLKPLLVKAVYSFKGKNNDELCFKKGDVITVTQQDDGWWEGTLGDTTGWFPSNYVTELKENVSSAGSSPVRAPSEIEEFRNVVLKDIIDSEKANIAELQGLVNNFLNPLESKDILSRDEFKQLTGNILETLHTHEQFLAQLEETSEKPSIDQRVGGLFLHWAPLIKSVHLTYCAGHPRAVCILDKYKDELNTFMESRGAVHPGLLVLTAGLSKPFRHLAKYGAMLQELARHVHDAHPDRGDTHRALHIYKDIAGTCASMRRQKELELQVVTGAVRGWNGGPLTTLGEVLYMGGVAVGPNHLDRYFVLFPASLLILSVSKRTSAFVFEGCLPLSGITCCKLPDTETRKNAFEVRAPMIDPIIAVCQTKNEADKWVSLLQRQLKHGASINEGQHPQSLQNSESSSSSEDAIAGSSIIYRIETPPATYPPASPYNSLTLYFSQLVKLKVITREMLRSILNDDSWAKRLETTGLPVQKRRKGAKSRLDRDISVSETTNDSEDDETVLKSSGFYSEQQNMECNNLSENEESTRETTPSSGFSNKYAFETILNGFSEKPGNDNHYKAYEDLLSIDIEQNFDPDISGEIDLRKSYPSLAVKKPGKLLCQNHSEDIPGKSTEFDDCTDKDIHNALSQECESENPNRSEISTFSNYERNTNHYFLEDERDSVIDPPPMFADCDEIQSTSRESLNETNSDVERHNSSPDKVYNFLSSEVIEISNQDTVPEENFTELISFKNVNCHSHRSSDSGVVDSCTLNLSETPQLTNYRQSIICVENDKTSFQSLPKQQNIPQTMCSSCWNLYLRSSVHDSTNDIEDNETNRLQSRQRRKIYELPRNVRKFRKLSEWNNPTTYSVLINDSVNPCYHLRVFRNDSKPINYAEPCSSFKSFETNRNITLADKPVGDDANSASEDLTKKFVVYRTNLYAHWWMKTTLPSGDLTVNSADWSLDSNNVMDSLIANSPKRSQSFNYNNTKYFDATKSLQGNDFCDQKYDIHDDISSCYLSQKPSGETDNSQNKTYSEGWMVVRLRPTPPLSANSLLNENSPRRSPQTRGYEHDALLLRVIAAYCASPQIPSDLEDECEGSLGRSPSLPSGERKGAVWTALRRQLAEMRRMEMGIRSIEIEMRRLNALLLQESAERKSAVSELHASLVACKRNCDSNS